ncbi:hypothetical protein CEUSTIGMA_g1698.t1 [Chlamydomonas eustigma]|uniref:WW domain-containing protein n=1 Tax=Chlamydomonas eustigma TaxID=1157962 RepID=A0A250WU51_9CHLO|nr:hypothetical protein CEUSTIGMA_g1698.t1 [Chlamydomonas eustigma]|eukprot:GAX74249.1 hypothetical protein CEUSTIGMA_g1698.t1 [Chlamydomonas eustigma]
MGTRTTPSLEHILHAARTLDINVREQSQLHLLAVAHAYLFLPLPTSWRRIIDETGEILYLDKRTWTEFKDHPELTKLRHAKDLLASRPPKGFEKRTCMILSRSDGSTYIHDFLAASNAKGQKSPLRANSDKVETVVAACEGANKLLTPVDAVASMIEEAAASNLTEDTTADAEKSETVTIEENPGNGEETMRNSQNNHDHEAALGQVPHSNLPDSANGLDQQSGIHMESNVAHAQEEESSLHGNQMEDRIILTLPQAWLQKLGITTYTPLLGEPQSLRFYSWWFEDHESTDVALRVSSNSEVGGGLKRRYITLDFELASHSFSMRTANEDQELVLAGPLPVLTHGGVQAEVWDLHVGAKLSIFGKPVTLLKAEGTTAAWLENHSKLLLQLKSDIISEILKYKPKSFEKNVAFNRGNGAPHPRGHKGVQGGLCLRFTVEQVHKLLLDLQHYRPDKFEKLRSRLLIHV